LKVTTLGLAILAIGLAAFVARPRWLPALTLFAVPFSATAVLNLPEFKLSLLASTFFGSLWLIRSLIGVSVTGATGIPRILVPGLVLLGCFVLAATISLAMPAYIAGRLSYVDISVTDFGTTRELKLSAWHVVHLLYLFYGALLAAAVAMSCQGGDALLRTLRPYVAGGLVVGLIGVGEWVSFQLGLQWPLVFLNNSASGAIAASRQLDDMYVVRISATAEEPSVLAQQLLAIVPFALFAVATRVPLLGSRLDRLALCVMAATLLLSTSATAYLGVGTLLLVSAIALVHQRSARLRMVLLLIAMGLTPAVAYAASPAVREFVQSYVLNKPLTGSGIERLSSVILGWGYFQSYPLFGVGWGVVPVFDLLVKILVGAGIIGAVTFLAFVGYALKALWDASGIRNPGTQVIAVMAGAGLVSLATTLAVSQTSGFLHQLGGIWVTMGLALGIGGSGRASAIAAAEVVRRGEPR
jgi:hypothetical protein